MGDERWKPGWQEDAFERGRGALLESPAYYRHLSPADVAEDAYLLGWASTLFLRGGSPPEKAPAAPPASPAGPSPVLGIPAFPYERCLKPGAETAEHFRQAREGRLGTSHRAAAEAAGGEEAWSRALEALYRAGALKTALPPSPSLHAPPLPSTGEDFQACLKAVGRKTLHALKIGFGLWGRWESP